jgi:predicted HicB family RNase H-like nuclease
MKTKKYIHLQVAEEIKEQLINEARQKGLSLNSYIRMIILGRKK